MQEARALDGTVTIRPLGAGDPVSELTRLLHRAYARQVGLGLRPLAGRQDDSVTRKRCSSGECYVAVRAGANAGDERIVGLILFHEIEQAKGPPWFQNRHVDSFSQFAVDPDEQGRGIGGSLLDLAERRARECGASELALSMAEPDRELYDYYIRRGYRFIEHWVWPYTNYRSAILSKLLR